ncbi:MAG: hypothetical protein K9N49_01095 [Candidatus Marinimicrobia bacterium]|nr:hypothetical protein [Candidatus Neomarinimicrobiota bacterium]
MKLQSEFLIVEISESNLQTTVTDRRNGAVWRTPGSGVTLCTYMVPEECHHWYDSDMASDSTDWLGHPVHDCEIALSAKYEHLAEFRLEFRTIELACNVRFELEGARLTVTVPQDSWNFHGELFYELQSLDLLPLFGAQPRGADGSLVLPHGGGTLRHFKDLPERGAAMADALKRGQRGDYARRHGPGAPDPTAPQSYETPVYGVNSQWREMIWFPLWGVTTGQSGFAAYIPLGYGDADAAIVATANHGNAQLCGAHARFHYRQHPRDTRVDEPRRLVFEFLDGEPDYAVMARVYRGYLVENEHIPTLRQRVAASPELAHQARSYFFMPMLGLKRFACYANPYPDGSGPLDIYMTFDDLLAEMQRAKENGVGSALVQMIGYNREGHDGSYPDIFPMEPKAGGEEGFARCVKGFREIGYRSSVHINLRCYSRSSLGFRYDTVMRDRDGGPVVNQTGPEGEDFNACPWAAAEPFYREFFPRLKELGLDGGIYTDFMLGVIFRCYQTRHGHLSTRRAYIEGCLAFLERCRAVFGSARAENAIAPSLHTVDASHTLIHPRRGESYLLDSELRQRGLCDEPVALNVVVYHGLVLYYNESLTLGQKDYWDHLLYNLAIGAMPRDELRGSSPQFDGLRTLEYHIFCEQLNWLQFEFIECIERHGDVWRTDYADGTTVWVNLGERPTTCEGGEVPARGFRVAPGTEEHEPLVMEEDPRLTRQPPAPLPNGSMMTGAPLRGAADVNIRIAELTGTQRQAPNPVTG